MKKLLNLAKTFGPSAIALVLPVLAAAQTTGPNPTNQTNVPRANINNLQDVLNSLCTVFAWLFYGLIVLAVIFVIYAAFKYLTAGGNPENVKAAGAVLLYAAVAVLVALLAKSIPLVVGNFVQASVTSTC